MDCNLRIVILDWLFHFSYYLFYLACLLQCWLIDWLLSVCGGGLADWLIVISVLRRAGWLIDCYQCVEEGWLIDWLLSVVEEGWLIDWFLSVCGGGLVDLLNVISVWRRAGWLMDCYQCVEEGWLIDWLLSVCGGGLAVTWRRLLFCKQRPRHCGQGDCQVKIKSQYFLFSISWQRLFLKKYQLTEAMVTVQEGGGDEQWTAHSSSLQALITRQVGDSATRLLFIPEHNLDLFWLFKWFLHNTSSTYLYCFK